MKRTFRLILLALIILVLGVATTVHAIDPDSIIWTPVTCADPPTSWNGKITSADQVDYYSIDLVAGQVLTIDVDAEDLSSLDSLLEVFDGAGNPIGVSDDDKAPGESSVVDPYFEFIADAEDTYYFAISASSKNIGDEGGNLGSYMLFLQCSEPSNPPGPITEVKTGDLLVTTGSASGSLISINPDNWESSLRFPLEIGPIADIDYDPISKMLIIAMDTGYPAGIVKINPNDDTIVAEFTYADGGFIALEVAGDTLYGVQFYYEDYDDIDTVQTVEKYSLVTISQTPDGLLGLETVASLPGHVSSLAYHSSENALYGVMGNELVKFDPALGEIVRLGELDVGTIVALDFDPDNFLYVATAPDAAGNPGKLLQINHTDLTIIREAGSFDVSNGSVNGSTFVVGAAPPNEEPVKTLCSSSLTSSTTASSETDVPKLSKFKLKNNPLHRAIGLFKFQGKAGEKITLRLAPEGEEAVMAGEESTVSRLLESWLECRGKGRVFLGIRDAIPNVDFRARKKDQIPFDMSADLPEDGYYYVMVIRPLLRFYQTDYCLTLESDRPDSEAWKTLDVVFPGDDSEEDTSLSADATKLAEPMSFEADAVATGTSNEPDSGDTIDKLTTFSSEPTTTNLTAGETPVEPATEATEEPTMMGSPPILEETAVNETGELAPVEEPTTEATEEPTMMGSPPIPEETAVDKTGEVAPEESADEISGHDESTDGSGSAEVADSSSDGAQSAEGGTSDVVEDKSMTEVPTS